MIRSPECCTIMSDWGCHNNKLPPAKPKGHKHTWNFLASVVYKKLRNQKQDRTFLWMKASIANSSIKEIDCPEKTCVPWSKFTRSGVSDGAGGPDGPMLPCTSSRVSLVGIYIVKMEDNWPCAMNQQFPIRRAAWIAVLWKRCGKQREKWLTDFVLHQLWVGVEDCVGSQISKVRHNGLCQQSCSHPHRDHKTLQL